MKSSIRLQYSSFLILPAIAQAYPISSLHAIVSLPSASVLYNLSFKLFYTHIFLKHSVMFSKHPYPFYTFYLLYEIKRKFCSKTCASSLHYLPPVCLSLHSVAMPQCCCTVRLLALPQTPQAPPHCHIFARAVRSTRTFPSWKSLSVKTPFSVKTSLVLPMYVLLPGNQKMGSSPDSPTKLRISKGPLCIQHLTQWLNC